MVPSQRSDPTTKAMKRNKLGQFIKGHGFWTGKKRVGFTNPGTFSKELIPWNTGVLAGDVIKCLTCGNDFYVTLSMIKKKIERCSIECRKKTNNCIDCQKPITLVSKRCRSCSNTGVLSRNWKGGITPISKMIRKSREYQEWRASVFERDNYTCQLCSVRGGELHPDHIKSFAYYPELRFELSNGRTLCVECHKQTPNYGYKARLVEGGGVYVQEA